jgi:hypothetical protein
LADLLLGQCKSESNILIEWGSRYKNLFFIWLIDWFCLGPKSLSSSKEGKCQQVSSRFSDW